LEGTECIGGIQSYESASDVCQILRIPRNVTVILVYSPTKSHSDEEMKFDNYTGKFTANC
jgi:hypothetical protein